MNKRMLLNIFAMCCVHSMAEARKYTDDYCWRDYDGTIPPDALPANGPNVNKDSIYIGQTIHKDKLIPGKLYSNDNKIYFEFYNVEYSTDENVKILCSQYPNKFEWIPTRHVDVLQLTTKILIKGGFEPNCSTYLGRTITAEGITPGKVICCTAADHCYGLYTTNNGTGTLHFDFQILTYNYNQDLVPPPDIDVRRVGPGKCKQITISIFN